MNDFPQDIVKAVAHRPWPIPDEPWIMTQSWHDLLARTMFRLPYHSATIDLHHEDGWIAYRSARNTPDPEQAVLEARYRPLGPVQHAAPGSLEHFLTERYCLYTVDDAFRAYRLEIHHLPWPLQTAEATIAANTMADAAGIRLPSTSPLLHFAKRLDVVAWTLKRVA
jgi:uncharacterized protein YqjF (DUF2071 family)